MCHYLTALTNLLLLLNVYLTIKSEYLTEYLWLSAQSEQTINVDLEVSSNSGSRRIISSLTSPSIYIVILKPNVL